MDAQASERAIQTAILLGRGERKEWALRVWLRLYGVAFPSAYLDLMAQLAYLEGARALAREIAGAL